jgi:hypothetical protein
MVSKYKDLQFQGFSHGNVPRSSSRTIERGPDDQPHIGAGGGTPVAGSFVFLGLPFLLVTGRGQVRRGESQRARRARR